MTDKHKQEIVPIARDLGNLGFGLVATCERKRETRGREMRDRRGRIERQEYRHVEGAGSQTGRKAGRHGLQ